jgi:hypothetical protein
MGPRIALAPKATTYAKSGKGANPIASAATR